MTNREPHLFDWFPEHAGEHRLINLAWEKAGERSGEKMRDSVEKLGPRYAEVIGHLRDAANYAGDENMKKLLSDPETVRMIAAQVELPPGNLSKKWLNAISIEFLRKAHSAFKSEEKELQSWKDKTTDQAKACAEIFRSTIAEIEAARTAFGEELPGLRGAPGAELMELLRKGAKQPELKEKFDLLVDLQKEILWASEEDLKSDAAWQKKLKNVGVSDALLADLGSASDPVARRKRLQELLQSAAGVLTDADQKKVKVALDSTCVMLATLDGDQRIHIQERFKERIKYLDRLGGTNQEAIIHMSL
ncbi:MAG: hypothetical protein PHE68_05930, partial [Candidatus Peribacteraceae bacterium]|nr:hypothetical protein [Candidatus Peribacteraceae bacterium]